MDPDAPKIAPVPDSPPTPSSTSTHLSDERSSADSRRAALAAALLYLVLAAMYGVVASQLWTDDFSAGLVVADAVAWHRNFAAASPETPLLLSRPGNFFLWLYELSPHANTALNAALLACTTAIVTLTAGRVGNARAALVTGSVMALNPWLWVLTFGPTKEPFALISAAATALFAVAPTKRHATLAILTILVTAPVRLEQSIMFAAILVATLLIRRVSRPVLVLTGIAAFSLAVGVVLFAVGERLMGLAFYDLSPQLWPLQSTQVAGREGAVGEIGRALGERGWHDPAWNAVAIWYRLAANVFGCIWRMGVVTVDGGPSVLGIGQAMSGLIVIAGLLVTLTRLRQRDDLEARGLAVHFLIIWLGTALVAFVQPRYLLVELPVAMAALTTATPVLRRRVILFTIALALLGRLAFFFAGFGIPADRHIGGPRPPFLELPLAEPASLPPS